MMLCTLVMFGCEKDESFLVGIFEGDFLSDGGFVRFQEGTLITTISVPEGVTIPNATFTLNLEDAGESNIASYQLAVRTPGAALSTAANLGGAITSFPANPTFSITDIATAMGIDPATVAFGQTFTFSGTATTTDGQVFDASVLTYDATTGAVSGSSTPILLNQAGPNGYRSAMEFSLTVNCPSWDPSFATAGVWNVLNDPTFGLTTVNVVLGPGTNEMTMIEPFSAGRNITIAFGANQVTTVAEQDSHIDPTFGLATLQGTGVSYSCVSLVSLNMFRTVAAGTFGARAFVIQKQ